MRTDSLMRVLTFLVRIDAELCVQFLVSLRFSDRLNVNSVLTNQIHSLASCHVKKARNKKKKTQLALIRRAGEINRPSMMWRNVWFRYLASVNTASRCSNATRTHGGAARSDLFMVEEQHSPSSIHGSNLTHSIQCWEEYSNLLLEINQRYYYHTVDTHIK